MRSNLLRLLRQLAALCHRIVRLRWWFSLVVDLYSALVSKLTYVGPVSTGMGDRVRVQFPVRDIYLGISPDTYNNSAWPSLRG